LYVAPRSQKLDSEPKVDNHDVEDSAKPSRRVIP
jgi:hypothetical protein